MKTLIPLAAILATAVVVAAPVSAAKPSGATIVASKPSIVYGQSVTLSGTVGNQQAGEQVIVMAEPYGAASFLPVATVDSSTGGAWSYVASPTVQTAYEAQWLTSTSRAIAVKVSPELTLAKGSVAHGRGTFTVSAKADRSFAGKFVLVQRLTANGPMQLKKVVLGSGSTATFTIRVQRGKSRLRAVMPTSQTQPGYVAARSATLTIHS